MLGAYLLISSSACAKPIQAPDIRKCQKAIATSPNAAVDNTTMTLDCCLPWHDIPHRNFSWDDYPVTHAKVRQAAHKADEEYIAKLNRAYELMKALPDDNPRSFKVQPRMHCAFCNGAYKQFNTNITLQIHFSWFFMLWHRL